MLSDCLEIKVNDFVSIVGSGGKTTMLFMLADELYNGKNKILATASTRIGRKQIPDDYKLLFTSRCALPHSFDYGKYAIFKELSNEGKVLSLTPEELCALSKSFQNTIIEADGSKMKYLKGWSEYEPVVPNATTKTIGVINFKQLGKPINNENVHRADIFAMDTGAEIGDIISFEHIKAIIAGKNGLFKSAKGKKILFLNLYDTNLGIAEEFCKFAMNALNFVDKIVCGNLHSGIYEKIR